MLANEAHRANIEKAFTQYLKSEFFMGRVYPGHFYAFCSTKKEFKNIDNTLCNRVQMPINDIAMRTNVSFRKTAPPKKTVEKAKAYLRLGLECAQKGDDCRNILKQELGDSFGDFGRYIPIATLKYLSDINFCVEDLPSMIRDDYPSFFKKMQEKGFIHTSQYIEHMLDASVALEQRETVELDEPGFLYCFTTHFKAQTKGFVVVKVGRTKNALERILNHKSAMVENQVVHLIHTPNSLSSEKNLIEYFETTDLSRPFYDPLTKRKSPEMFELPALYGAKMFADFTSSL